MFRKTNDVIAQMAPEQLAKEQIEIKKICSAVRWRENLKIKCYNFLDPKFKKKALLYILIMF